ncbi:MAG: iron-sulfur cluster assembly accessory protein [Cellvibrionaceae bacterium]|nr:iron-sulfur cluster assembly accessory protein [Cellvibrionaceae bacterium]
MTVETFSPEDVVSVTSAAQQHFSAQLSKTGMQAIRLSLKESGCTGFKYVIDEVSQAQEGDVKIAMPNNLQLLVAADSIGALRGTEIDYVQQGLNRSLVLNNPNVKDACGCGESFNFS